MSKIVLSIILPLYQAEDHIAELFSALDRQTGINANHIEILLWDDGSTDATHVEIKEHKPLLQRFSRVRVQKSKINLGLFMTRLLAAQAAQGEFITFIDKQTRPYSDYISQLLAQNWPLVVGNPVMDKTRSMWDRVLFLIRRKLYFPYFGSDFPDLTLPTEQYCRFKNKGGGGALLVKRGWFLAVASNLISSKHTNDDSHLITKLTSFFPLRKTAKAKLLYINRTGFRENVLHLFWRGPKFIDFYLWPWNRYSLFIFSGLLLISLQPALLLYQPSLFLAEVLVAILALFFLSIWLAEEPEDFFTTFWILPLAVLCFGAGSIVGIGIKIQRLIRK